MFQATQLNGELIKALIGNKKNMIFWDKISHEVVKCIPLESSSPEYLYIKNKFLASMKHTVHIKKIERIENPYLLAAYEIKRAEISHRFHNVRELFLFHGTSAQKAQSICLSNFDWRLSGTSRGHRFGKGISFSPKSTYSWHYCRFEKVMLLSFVLVSSSHIGTSTTRLPRNGFDTTQKLTGDVIVKYEDNEFYPAYKIFF